METFNHGSTLQDLYDCAKRLKLKVSGYFARDELTLKQLESLKSGNYILNYDDSMGHGTHFACFIVRKGRKIEFFSSFGDPPLKAFVDASKDGWEVDYNDVQEQAVRSKMCGMFCLMFLYLRKKRVPFETIVDHFFQNKSEAQRMRNNLLLFKFLNEAMLNPEGENEK